MKPFKGIVLLTLTVILLAACKSTQSSKAEVIALNGMIYDTSNRPVVNYTIFIDGKKECVTDIGGRFYIKKISRDIHDLYGEGEGYLNIRQKITVTDKSQVLYIRLPSVEDKLKQALDFLDRGELEEAERCVEEILESDENNSDALFFKAALCLLQGKEVGGDNRYEEELKKMLGK